MAVTDSGVWDGAELDAWIYPMARAEQEGALPLAGGKEFVVGVAPGGRTAVVCPPAGDHRETSRVWSSAVEHVASRGARSIGLVLEGMSAGETRGAYLGSRSAAYRFTRYRAADHPAPSLRVRIEPDRLPELEVLCAVADAQDRAREWVSIAPNEKPPERMAAMFREDAPPEVEFEFLDGAQLSSMGAGGLIGVGSAATPAGRGPAALLGRHRGADGGAPWLALVGKGITFDSGGLSLKPGDGMLRMKGDMAGAAAVMAALQAIARLAIRVNVVAVAALAENLVGGSGYRPGDVLRMLDGTHVEIVSTDAEGRLVLADGVTIARRAGAQAIVDVATLTGANVVALGGLHAGMISNDAGLADLVRRAAAAANEPTWELPSDAAYRELLQSPVADLRNSAGRPAGVITGGLFVGHFAQGVPWVHVDIAGMALDARSGRGNGFGVAMLVAVAQAWADRGR